MTDAEAEPVVGILKGLCRLEQVSRAAQSLDRKHQSRYRLLGDDIDHTQSGIGPGERRIQSANDFNSLYVLKLYGNLAPKNLASQGGEDAPAIHQHLQVIDGGARKTSDGDQGPLARR